MVGPAPRSSCGRAHVNSGWSCRFICGAADRDTLRRQVAIEQDLVVELMGAHRDAFRLIGPLKRGEDKAWPSIAEDDRCYDDVQAIKAAGGKETRNRIGAAPDEYGADSEVGQ